jgi:glycosyltransferase involved in cell wall biosynthesis
MGEGNHNVSIVIASVAREQSLRECLESATDEANGAEIVVATSEEPQTLELRAKFPHVRFIIRPAEASVFELRSAGIEAAHGDIIALAEGHTTFAPGWLSALLDAHAKGHEIVGGPVDNGLTKTIGDWALYCSEYVAFMPPLPQGPAAVLSGVNVSYRRALLQSCHAVWEKAFYETDVHDELVARGHKMHRASAAIAYSHLRMGLIEGMGHLFRGGRKFGGHRRGMSTALGLLKWVITLPLVPVVLVARIMRHMVRRPSKMFIVVLGIPRIVLLISAWSLGEALGVLFPPAPAASPAQPAWRS